MGNDILQYFSELDLSVVNLFGMSVKVLRLANGCIPFGSMAPFIHLNKRREFLDKVANKFGPCEYGLQVEASESNCDLKFKNSLSYSSKAKLSRSNSL